MKTGAKRIIGKVHLWLGLASGLVIFIVALTGAIYVFSNDIIEVTESSFAKVEPQATRPLLPSQLTAIALQERTRFLGNKKVAEWDWATLYVFSGKDRAVRFTSRHYENPNQLVDIFINPYTGEVLHTRDTYAYPFWDFIANLHTTLLLGSVGTYIVEYGTLVFLLMLISGIVLWWPANKAALKQRFRFRWKAGFSWKRKNYDLHTVLGFYASWIVIFMAITGLTWSFAWVKDTMYFLLRSEPSAETNFKLATPIVSPDSAAVIMDGVYQAVKRVDTAAYCYNLSFATKADEPVNVYAMQTKNWSPGNNYYFNPQTGALLSTQLYSHLSAGEKYEQMTGDIHYGWVFGWPSKIAVFLACLIVASLPVTGFMIWRGRKSKQNK